MPASRCSARLVRQTSLAPCNPGVSFGCLANDPRQVWVHKCRGIFRCDGGGNFLCGNFSYDGYRYDGLYTCGCEPSMPSPQQPCRRAVTRARRHRCPSGGPICIFVLTEAGRPAYLDRLVSVAVTWATTPLPANTSLHFVLSAHGISSLFDQKNLSSRVASLRASAAARLAKHMAASAPHISERTPALRNDNLVVLDDSIRDSFRLEPRAYAQRLEWAFHAARERFASACEWIVMTEDDTYVDMHAVRWAVDCLLAPVRERQFWYTGQVFGHTWGDFVHAREATSSTRSCERVSLRLPGCE